MAAVTTTTSSTTGDVKSPVVAPRPRPSVLPYVLLVPTVVVLGAMLGYPLVRLVTMSMQEYGLPQVFGQPAAWVGFENFRTILEDAYFWTVLWRTLIFCFTNVVLTMVLGVLVALLLDALGRGMRLLVSASLIIAWAMPATMRPAALMPARFVRRLASAPIMRAPRSSSSLANRRR